MIIICARNKENNKRYTDTHTFEIPFSLLFTAIFKWIGITNVKLICPKKLYKYKKELAKEDEIFKEK